MTRAPRSDVLTTSQAARLCRVTANTVANWVDAGRLPAFRTAGGHRRVRREDLLKFMKQQGIPLPGGPDGSGRRRCLIVDDDPQVSGMLKEFLLGIRPEVEVRVAADGFEAGRLSSEFRPDAVLLDIRMPGMDGFEVCRRIKADPTLASTVVVAMTGYATEDAVRKMLEAGAVACLEKPLDLRALHELLNEHVPPGSVS